MHWHFVTKFIIHVRKILKDTQIERETRRLKISQVFKTTNHSQLLFKSMMRSKCLTHTCTLIEWKWFPVVGPKVLIYFVLWSISCYEWLQEKRNESRAPSKCFSVFFFFLFLYFNCCFIYIACTSIWLWICFWIFFWSSNTCYRLFKSKF